MKKVLRIEALALVLVGLGIISLVPQTLSADYIDEQGFEYSNRCDSAVASIGSSLSILELIDSCKHYSIIHSYYPDVKKYNCFLNDPNMMVEAQKANAQYKLKCNSQHKMRTSI